MLVPTEIAPKSVGTAGRGWGQNPQELPAQRFRKVDVQISQGRHWVQARFLSRRLPGQTTGNGEASTREMSPGGGRPSMGPGRLAGTAQVEGTECWPMRPEAWAAWRAHMGWERRGGWAQGSAGPVSRWQQGTPEQGARGRGQGLSQAHWMETETTPRASTLHAAVRQLRRRAGSPHLRARSCPAGLGR